MKKNLKYSFYVLLNILLITQTSFSQCTVSVTGSDFTWCTPCQGSATANASNGTAPYTYYWSTSDTTAFINGLCAGTYTISITDSLGCTATDSVTINQTGTTMTVSLSATAASCPTCCDICVTPNITGGCIPYTLSWSPGDPNWPSPCGACPFQTYTVTVTDACGCTAVDSITTDTVGVGTGLLPLQEKTTFSIYPNPAADYIIIDYNLPIGQQPILEIYSVTGTLIKKQFLTSTTHDISELTDGIYMVIIRTENGQQVQSKLIKLE